MLYKWYQRKREVDLWSNGEAYIHNNHIKGDNCKNDKSKVQFSSGIMHISFSIKWSRSCIAYKQVGSLSLVVLCHQSPRTIDPSKGLGLTMFASIQGTLSLRMQRRTWARLRWRSMNQHIKWRSKGSIEDPIRQARSSRYHTSEAKWKLDVKKCTQIRSTKALQWCH
jgi:hypothetical protein